MKIIAEDKYGHPLRASAWIDSDGSIRLIVQNFCPICDNINITEEAKELAKQIVRDIRGGTVDEKTLEQLG